MKKQDYMLYMNEMCQHRAKSRSNNRESSFLSSLRGLWDAYYQHAAPYYCI